MSRWFCMGISLVMVAQLVCMVAIWREQRHVSTSAIQASLQIQDQQVRMISRMMIMEIDRTLYDTTGTHLHEAALQFKGPTHGLSLTRLDWGFELKLDVPAELDKEQRTKLMESLQNATRPERYFGTDKGYKPLPQDPAIPQSASPQVVWRATPLFNGLPYWRVTHGVDVSAATKGREPSTLVTISVAAAYQ